MKNKYTNRKIRGRGKKKSIRKSKKKISEKIPSPSSDNHITLNPIPISYPELYIKKIYPHFYLFDENPELPEDIFLYFPREYLEDVIVKGEVEMSGLGTQMTIKDYFSGLGGPFPLLQFFIEPGTSFGFYVFVGNKKNFDSEPCQTSGAKIFKHFLFHTIRKLPDLLKLLELESMNDINFKVISFAHAPLGNDLTPEDFLSNNNNYFGKVLKNNELENFIKDIESSNKRFSIIENRKDTSHL